jgi:hypothetical protein
LSEQTPDTAADAPDLIRRHLRVGWSMLLVFLTLGTTLEAFHGFKVGWYLDTDHATRRLMLTLAHAHGVLLGLVNLAFALTVHLRPGASPRRGLASVALVCGSLLLPGGFLLGGLVVYEGDPGIGIYVAPIGALSLLAAVALILRGLTSRDQEPAPGGRHEASRRRSGDDRRT